MGTIRGRSDDMLIIRGVNFFPSQIESLIPEFSPDLSANYQVRVSKIDAMDHAKVAIEYDPGIEAALQSLSEAGRNEKMADLNKKLVKSIKQNIGLSMEVEICTPGTVPRSEGGKLQRVLDIRK